MHLIAPKQSYQESFSCSKSEKSGISLTSLFPDSFKSSIIHSLSFILLLISMEGRSQDNSNQPKPDQPGKPYQLTIGKIMQDPAWIGNSPSNMHWSLDGNNLFFSWNPDKAPHDSLYYITRADHHPRKASYEMRQENLFPNEVIYNTTRSAYTYSKEGDIFWADAQTGKVKRITRTVETESDPEFSFHDTKIVYTRDNNLFSWDITTGLTEQLSNFQQGPPPSGKKELFNTQEQWLKQDQLEQFDVLRNRKAKNDAADSMRKLHPAPKKLKTIYLDEKELFRTNISPDGRFISYILTKHATDTKNTIVPNYVTESGFTRDIPARTKVGAPQDSYTFFIFDREKDTIIKVSASQIPGIRDLPDYVRDYPASTVHGISPDTLHKDSISPRPVIINGPYWSDNGTHAVVDIRSMDNKDRWLMLLDAATGTLKLLDRQRDEAWIAGPGIGYHFGGGHCGWINENTFWYQSEASGYSHLYRADVNTGTKTQLTSGRYEIQKAALSKDKKYFYITTNETDPGEQQFYHLPVTGGRAERITTLTGGNDVAVSPDEKKIAILYSYSNRPWELYLQDNRTGTRPEQITNLSMSEAFRSYPWRDPEIITFPARDGSIVHARIYRPGSGSLTTGKTGSGPTLNTAPSSAPNNGSSASPPTTPGHPAVIFVHGAGYLQNAHKWWSYYFREFMFNNMLADNGYTVLDIDYRGSAGYGRDWRTGIYRHMGGKDLTDQLDGVKFLVEHEGVDPAHVGLYGGSYGGFITLMALFTEPDVFKAGAAIRSVTDWAHYNHEYTSDILNEPATDSLAYRRSSPIYFANGLKGHLLMCHGMVDENVHFQDIIRLSQRLIELGKDNWELAVYPVEDHGFVEPSSWTDEYKRIFRLFETNLH